MEGAQKCDTAFSVASLRGGFRMWRFFFIRHPKDLSIHPEGRDTLVGSRGTIKIFISATRRSAFGLYGEGFSAVIPFSFFVVQQSAIDDSLSIAFRSLAARYFEVPKRKCIRKSNVLRKKKQLNIS